jgi:hypothetical protein
LYLPISIVPQIQGGIISKNRYHKSTVKKSDSPFFDGGSRRKYEEGEFLFFDHNFMAIIEFCF